MDDEAFWSSDPNVLRDTEWDKISSEFTNAGYREGITAGKEGALQEGFDDGFATVGAPIGRELGILRGLCSALLAFLSPADPSQSTSDAALANEVREIAAALVNVRFSDIAPPDLEAIAHAREHLEPSNAMTQDEDAADLTDPAKLNEEIKDKRDMENLEDLMAQVGSSNAPSVAPARPTTEDVTRLKARLMSIAQGLGLPLQWS
ncbi:hypothetical protein L226DRAFT_610974 [Lentinus tigrinus ALCF2SS1-7]|uniref:Protein YAE1 n=1 Tax=Lentinus tigrinus ALCF2SS1-6 TaxID=1328759 RepID=A0A5C2SFE2_9APHY|nr:hypothetical protein L227DRAFT_499013 [Lentinus tigrinus ALCF2SS1-6]RPD77750.1 hypothetical protein L226DRAFT_610974 [Lentinus tigrinus ALCF2SS1-7]